MTLDDELRQARRINTIAVGLSLGLLACSPRTGVPDAGRAMSFLDSCEERHHDQDELRPNECPADAEDLPPFEPIFRSIAFASDEDWYRFTFPPGSETADFSDQTGTVVWRFFDEDGVDLGGPQLLDRRERPFYARVSAVPGHAERQEYWGSFEVYQSDDFPNVAERATLIDPAGASGAIDHWVDQDWLRLSVVPGRKYRLHLSFGNDWPSSVSCEFSDGSEAPRALELSFDPNGAGRVVTILATQTQTIVLGLVWHRPYAVPDNGIRWQVRVEELGADDFPDDAQQAHTVALDGTMTGLISGPVDVDWFVLPPQDPSHFFGFELMGSNLSSSLWETSGDLVATPGVVYQGQPRERRVVVFGDEGPWSVELRDLGVFVDVSGERTAATPVTVGLPFDGLFEVPNDADAYAFSVTQHHFYGLSVVAADAGLTSVELFDTFEQSHGTFANLVELRASRSGQNTAVLTWRSSKAFVTYRLEVTDLGADEPDIPAAIPSGGVQLVGALQSRLDVDHFVLAATDPLTLVHLDATEPIFVTEVLTDGGRLLHHPDAGADFGVRAQTLDHLELAPGPGTTVPATWALSANPSPTGDDFDDVVPTPIAIGTALYGRLDSFDDVDLLSFDLASAGPFRVHVAPGCAFIDLVRPAGGTFPIFDGHLSAWTPGTHLLRIHTERCGYGAWGVTVTVP